MNNKKNITEDKNFKQLIIRNVPIWLHKQIKSEAAQREMTMQSFMLKALETFVKNSNHQRNII